jgi:hypothetical protein
MPGQAQRVPGGSKISRHSVHEDGKDSQPYAPAVFTSQEISLVLIYLEGRVIDIATDYGLEGPGSNPGVGGRDLPSVQTGPGAHPASCKMGTGSFPEGKVRPGRAADHSPASSAAVMEE